MAKPIRTAVNPRGNRRRYLLILACISLVAGMMIAYLPGALAVHDTGAFELEGDAVAEVTDDWDRVCNEVTGGGIPGCSTAATTSAEAVSWTNDGALNASIFTGGGSKDPMPISEWAWKDEAGGLPDKANLLHSFAARYSLPASEDCPTGGAATCELLYFGSDRFDNSGDAVQGFWFFQDSITLGNQKLGGGFNFEGQHIDGDLLVISEFSNGGGTSTIIVYQWDSNVAGNLVKLAESTAANCADVGDNDAFCGIVNSADGTTAPWPSFVDKSGNNSYLNGEFFEGGINLSLLGLADTCFASFASETRTSTSVTSVLKDFVLGPFAECTTDLVTTPDPSGDVVIGSAIQDTAILNVAGVATWSGTLDFYLCTPAELTPANTGECTTGGTLVSSVPVTEATAQPIASGGTATADEIGRHCWRGEFSGDPVKGVPAATDASAGECINVITIPTALSTSQWIYPNDTATIAVDAGGDLVGSLQFKLYDSLANCSANDVGGLLYTETVQILDDDDDVSGADSEEASTSNSSVAVSSSSTVYWRVLYTSDVAAQEDRLSDCVENTAVTFVNDAGPGTLP